MRHATRLALSDLDRWLDARPYASRLVEGGVDVECVYRPSSSEELKGALREARGAGLSLVPIGAGRGGTRRPGGRVALVDTGELPAEIRIDRRSCIAQVSAATSWWKLGEQVTDAGLMLGPIVDARPKRSVAGTLCSRQILPPLWLARSARSLCIGMHAVDLEGEEYRYREAPRTSSGPDLRAFFFDAEGRAGVVTQVALQLMPIAPVDWLGAELPWGAWARIRRLIELHPSTVTLLRGTAAHRFRVALVRGTRASEHAAIALASLGFIPSEDDGDDDTSAVAVSLPWQQLAAAARSLRSRRVDLRIVGAGPTHVTIAARLQAPDAETTARAWAARVAAKAPGLGRVVSIGLLDEEAPAWALGALTGAAR